MILFSITFSQAIVTALSPRSLNATLHALGDASIRVQVEKLLNAAFAFVKELRLMVNSPEPLYSVLCFLFPPARRTCSTLFQQRPWLLFSRFSFRLLMLLHLLVHF